jgi:hypothetical protein
MRRRGAGAVAVGATVALGAGLLMGAQPAAASTGAGIVVSASIFEGSSEPNWVMFRATSQMVESEVAVNRQGSTVVVTELEGGPSLAVEPPTDSRISCTASNPSGLSDEIRCTFSGSTASSGRYSVGADFRSAPRGITFGSDGTSQLEFLVLGSEYDDYIQGGPLADRVAGFGGDDFIFGGAGDDILDGGDGDDVIYGDGDDDRERGNDQLFGGNGDDYLEGGPGNDRMYGGAGFDELDAKDGEADDVVDCNDSFSRLSKPNADALFDARLDTPFDCGGVTPPIAQTFTMLRDYTGVSVGKQLVGIAPGWLGTEPLDLSYRWEACTLSASRDVVSCSKRTTGSLNSKGLDPKTGKAPVYTVTKADAGRAIRLVTIADNSSKRGGAVVENPSPFTLRVEPPLTLEIPTNFLPTGSGSKWSFSDFMRVSAALTASKASPWLNVITRGWERRAVPNTMRKPIKDGQVFSIRVNGKEVTSKDREFEIDKSRKTDVEIRFYSMLEDRKTCPASDNDLQAYQRAAAAGSLSLLALTNFLDSKRCAWAVTWADQVGTSPIFTVSGLSLEYSDDEDRPVQVRITARKPTTAAGLAIAVGAPPRDIVRQSPDHFTLGVAGAVYAFPGSVFTSLWVSLIGDQVRQGTGQSTVRARMQMFVNGRLQASQELSREFSSIPATVLTEPGLVRIVMTTFASNGAAIGQAYVDVPVRDPLGASMSDLVTLDGRCFSISGQRLSSCQGRTPHPNVATIQRLLSQAQAPQVATYAPLESLRYASDTLNKRFTPIVVNGVVPGSVTAPRVSVVPRSGCAWWDLPCIVRGVAIQVVNAVIRAKNAATASFRVKSPVVGVPQSGALPSVTTGLLALIPGLGLIGLDGATLISDQGGSLISDQGGSLISDQGGSLIGLDGATLIGLDGATLKPNQVSLPLMGLNGAT